MTGDRVVLARQTGSATGPVSGTGLGGRGVGPERAEVWPQRSGKDE